MEAPGRTWQADLKPKGGGAAEVLQSRLQPTEGASGPLGVTLNSQESTEIGKVPPPSFQGASAVSHLQL